MTSKDHLSSNLTFNTAQRSQVLHHQHSLCLGIPGREFDWTAPFLDGKVQGFLAKSSQHDDLRDLRLVKESVVYTLIYFMYIYIYISYHTFIHVDMCIYLTYISLDRYVIISSNTDMSDGYRHCAIEMRYHPIVLQVHVGLILYSMYCKKVQIYMA